MLKIGLTGGIGTGKTTVAKCFAELGVPTIEADAIVRDLLQQQEGKAYTSIVKHFGPKVISPKGNIKRRYLRKVIFNNDKERNWIETLLHPIVYKIMTQQVRTLQASPIPIPYCILVIPVLLEAKKSALVDYVLMVKAHPTTQIQRTLARDKTSNEDVENIIRIQIGTDHKLAKPNDIIDNNDSISELRQKIQEEFHPYYTRLSASKTKLKGAAKNNSKLKNKPKQATKITSDTKPLKKSKKKIKIKPAPKLKIKPKSGKKSSRLSTQLAPVKNRKPGNNKQSKKKLK